MATTNHCASVSAEGAHAPRFRFGSFEAWRAALFVSLGLGAACADTDQTALPGTDEPALPDSLRCEGDIPRGQDGLWHCDNGIIHRVEPSTEPPCIGCLSPTPRPPPDECASDGECPAGTLCAQTRDLVRTGTQCGATATTAGPAYFACLTSADACGADDQCSPGAVCTRSEGIRGCYRPSSFPCGVPGRPFLVGAEIRRAPLRAADGWCDANIAPADGLDERQRVSAARHYQQAALLEHASIAAFARFTLQLLELGAPADLCSAAQEAMRDETLHAQLCFTLASRYAGQPLAPGPLSMSGVLVPATLDDVARLCLLEGCVGETLAAIEAAEALAGATDPEVRRALERIAQDERRHAELAFRFVAWALEQRPHSGLRHALAAVLEATVGVSRCAADDDAGSQRHAEPSAANEGSSDDARLEAHGLLPERRRIALRRAVLEEVVVPCVRRLLAEAGARRSQPPAFLGDAFPKVFGSS
jgi:hypothetical protein